MKVFHAFASLLFFLMFFGTSCDVISDRRVNGSGNVITTERNINAFQRLDLQGSMDVYLTQGPVKPAVIVAEDNIIPFIELIDKGGELEVRFKHDTRINSDKDIKIYLSSPAINEVRLSGSGGIRLENKFSAEGMMQFTSVGSGDISGVINAPQVKASIAGSGNVKLQGETREMDVNIAGSGDYEGGELMAENVTVNIAGSGDAKVHASVKLDARIVGSGDVKYKGTPQISSNIIGSGVVQKND